MNRTYFRNLSLLVVASLTLLAGVQCWWVTKMYREQESDFQRRVESAAYKSVYKSFRMDAIPGLVAAQRINIDLDDFALTFDPALLELDAMTVWQAEIIDRTLESLQSTLPEVEFFRANRQFIVARKAVKDITVWFGSRLSLNLSVQLPEKIIISKARVPEFKHWLMSVGA